MSKGSERMVFSLYTGGKKTQGKLFGRPLLDTTTQEKNQLSKPVRDMMSILFREGPFTVGIFRKSADARRVEALKQRLDDGEDCLTNETWQPLVVGSVLKVCAHSVLVLKKVYTRKQNLNTILCKSQIIYFAGIPQKHTKQPPYRKSLR